MDRAHSLHAAIAAHRFGLGEASFEVAGSDPRGWLAEQIGPADAAYGERLLDTHQALQQVEAERERRRRALTAPSHAAEPPGSALRDISVADARSRLLTAAVTTRPFAERLKLFWANHFSVSLARSGAAGLVGAFERDAVRPHIAGSFETLLLAAITHPAMLRYLDNTWSAGPHSEAARMAAIRTGATGQASARRIGLNDALAREVLQRHTLGAAGLDAQADAQADIAGLARILSGWRGGADPASSFDAAWHEPGSKRALGRDYAEGPDALGEVVRDLARHPATARLVATKLARHFVADAPPPALVERLAAAYRDSEGDLASVYGALIASPEAWNAEAAKVKTAEEFVVSTVRVLGISERVFDRVGTGNPGAAIVAMGQRILAAPTPAGWSDLGSDWLAGDALWHRLEWAARTADSAGRRVDARAVAERSFGPWLGAATKAALAEAADGPQALGLFLMAREFQRR